MRTIIFDSGLFQNLWNEVLSANVLTLNQIPAHRGKKSLHELFKNKKIPLSYFHPIGNPVVVLSNDKKSKLDPRGKFDKLIGFNLELKYF
jgi:hypothetical protein